MGPGRVLVVGVAADRDALAELLAMHGYHTSVAALAAIGDAVRAWRPDVVIADVRSPEIEGPAFTAALAAMSPRPRAIVISACPCRAFAAGGVPCLVKPLKLERLLRVLGAPELAA